MKRFLRVSLPDCPGCGKLLKKHAGPITTSDESAHPPLLVQTTVCPTCARRIENSPSQRPKILKAIRQTFRLLVDVGGDA